MAEINLIAAKEALVQRLAELEAESDQSESSRETVELDQTKVGRLSRMDALQGQAMAQALDRRRAQEAARIYAALRRIEQGEFGFCISCGEPIPPKRLELDLSVATCVQCASAASS